LFKKDGHRAQISSVGCKLLYEIHPRINGPLDERYVSALVLASGINLGTNLSLYDGVEFTFLKLPLDTNVASR
jgi:hypothetical protein